MTLSMRSEAAGLCRASWPDRDALKDHGSALVYGVTEATPILCLRVYVYPGTAKFERTVERFKCGKWEHVLSVRAPFRGEDKFRSVTINSGSQFIGSMTSLSYY